MIAADLRQSIVNGDWKPGVYVTVAELRERYGEAVRPVRIAVALLRRDGLVETRTRFGTRVKQEGQLLCACPGFPLYRQVARLIRQRLAEQTYPLGTALPPMKLLADELGVSTPCVHDGIRLLQAEGILSRPRRRSLGVVVLTAVPAEPATPEPTS